MSPHVGPAREPRGCLELPAGPRRLSHLVAVEGVSPSRQAGPPFWPLCLCPAVTGMPSVRQGLTEDLFIESQSKCHMILIKTPLP